MSAGTPRPLDELDPAQRHRVVTGRFAEVLAQVDDWQAPTPVVEWVALDIVAHLLEWFPAFLAAGGIEVPPGPSHHDDPQRAWEARRGSVQALLDDPASSNAIFSHPHAGSDRLDVVIDRFYTADVFLHTWDLGRSAGIEPNLDPGWSRVLLAGLEPIADLLRASGQYGEPVPGPTDDDPQRALVAFIGRDPDWQPGS